MLLQVSPYIVSGEIFISIYEASHTESVDVETLQISEGVLCRGA